jgi:two-component system, NtrC family, sensor kinase
MKKLLLFLILIIGVPQKSFSNERSFVFNNANQILQLNQYIDVLVDSASRLTISEVHRSTQFKPSSYKVPNLGVTKFSYWLRFSIQNNTNEKNLLLQLTYPLMDVADLYYMNTSGKFTVIKSGEQFPYSKRKYNNQNFIYDIEIEKNTSQTFYLKINATELLLAPLEVGTFQKITESNSSSDLISGILIGIVFVMFLYNFFLYLTLKDIAYLYYILYILFIGLTQINLLGYSGRMLYPNNLWLINHSLYIFASLGGIAITLFVYNFLKIKIYAPRFKYVLLLFALSYTIALIVALFDNQRLSYNIIDINALSIAICISYVCIKIISKGYKPARYFLIGWMVFLIGVVFFVLRNFGILEYNNFTNYTMPAGTAFELTLLSIALGDRINILKREKEKTQADALEASLKHKLIITNQNITLERNVLERTKELQQANFELSQKISELKQTQTQLVNSEKMASLGQLTAGIAHEINNPINFVVSNIKPLRRDINDIYQLIDTYESIYKNSNSEINLLKAKIDYGYIKNEIEVLLKGLEDGAERTADIVRGLRIFSRLDENDLKHTNIIEGIESTLTLLNTEITHEIDVIKDFNTIPEIDCYPGKLNQVFMNILNNALFAIKENTTRIEKGLLQIKTSHNDTTVFIVISDNGIGMKEDVLYKIYEPFFTTKNVGKGTGLGLSIAYSIIEAHHGSIKVESTYGKGSTFTISIPLRYIEQ